MNTQAVNEHATVGAIPRHHSAPFVNEHGYSYYSNHLVPEGFVVLFYSLKVQGNWGSSLHRFILPALHTRRHWVRLKPTSPPQCGG